MQIRFFLHSEMREAVESLMFFAHIKALSAESELAKFCLKYAGCVFRHVKEMSKPSSAWNILLQTFMFMCLKQRQDFFWLICGFTLCTCH